MGKMLHSGIACVFLKDFRLEKSLIVARSHWIVNRVKSCLYETSSLSLQMYIIGSVCLLWWFSLFLRDCVIHYCSGYYPPCVFSYVKSRHTFVAAAVVTWVLLGVLFSARILKRLFVVFVSEPITSFPYLGSRMRVIYLLAVYNTVQKQTGLRTCSRSYRRFIPVWSCARCIV